MRNLYTFSQLILLGRPAAQALLRGAAAAPALSGTVQFYRAGEGTQVVAELFGLPEALRVEGETERAGPFYALRIAEMGSCGDGLEADRLADALVFNPAGAPHPLRAGDLPPLLGCGGYAYASFYTGSFSPDRVIGKSLLVYQTAGDFHTQPNGAPGLPLACGEIE